MSLPKTCITNQSYCHYIKKKTLKDNKENNFRIEDYKGIERGVKKENGEMGAYIFISSSPQLV